MPYMKLFIIRFLCKMKCSLLKGKLVHGSLHNYIIPHVTDLQSQRVSFQSNQSFIEAPRSMSALFMLLLTGGKVILSMRPGACELQMCCVVL